jgi:hypothetical protein
MKALKLVLVAAILSLAMVGYAADDKENPTRGKTVKITLKEALQSPRMIKAMYAQLDLSKLKKLWSGYCCGSVNVGGVNYKIFGPEVAWIKFFRKSPGKIVKEPRTRHVPL